MKPPYAILDGEGEVYVSHEAFPNLVAPGQDSRPTRSSVPADDGRCAPLARDVTGRLFAPTSDGKSMVMVRFKIPASRANSIDARQTFYQFKKRHYEQLLGAGCAGGGLVPP